jgi:hypothetical protein
MEWIGAGSRLYPHITKTRVDIFALKPNARQRLVVVGPVRVDFFFTPRRTLAEHGAGGELIVPKNALPVGMMA